MREWLTGLNFSETFAAFLCSSPIVLDQYTIQATVKSVYALNANDLTQIQGHTTRAIQVKRSLSVANGSHITLVGMEVRILELHLQEHR